MSTRLGTLFFILLCCQSSWAKILISTVAQVQKHVITTREIEIHTMLQKSLSSDIRKFRVEQSTEQIIREWLLYFEASSFYSNKVSASEIQDLQNKVQSKLGKSSQWKALAVSKKELKKKISRHLQANRLYLFKKKASALPVSKAEIETEYNQNRIRYGNLSFDEVKDKIRSNKANENLRNRLEQWFRVLEKKYRVQRFTRVG